MLSRARMDEISLRTIVVSAGSAMRTATDEDGREYIAARAEALLAELESRVRRRRGNAEVLHRIRAERRRFRSRRDRAAQGRAGATLSGSPP